MKNHLTYRTKVHHLKVRPYQFSILYTSNCSINIKEEKSHDEINIPKGTISFIERNQSLQIHIIKEHNGDAYKVHTLTSDTVRNLINILEPSLKFIPVDIANERKLKDKIHIVPGDGINKILFQSIKENEDAASEIYKIACLILKSDKPEKIYWSLRLSASSFFSDRVKNLIESDLTQKWRLSTISEMLSLSEIAVRKKLEAENTSFYQILLDARMQKAAKLILDENHHLRKVASSIGMSSTSYFIKTFSSYYGATPKQFYLYFKNISHQ
ncbi:helix-turn-helix transcriptional regulator [Cronobacter dublinensis]|uniref:AraC family transcriptional regulator n=1 Tax=Cronobacter TaxID=413496 RepID=UPI0024C40BBA|nr:MULTISPECIES: helix-turn-helix transcriptional regulator [Cronobacter]MDK1192437.1 helix-turn-helix transcriptional regulator [Cronobacter dublinensis]MDK1203894.1 helix-turn-helix transcriptional regulator [Cronobacter dublinensis]MDK1237660.1 helix-turn-helix transcriptional regulator [Cronobacter turicensis]HDI3035225.1 helix-turn-helix transcriptional regulator [Cronobacter turicensis]